MPKKKEEKEQEVVDSYVGSDPMDDDLMDMEYIQRDDTSAIDTHPPETIEEAEARAAATPEEVAKDEPEEEEAEEEEAVAEVLEEEEKENKVPYSRFDEVNKKRIAAEEETAKLKKKLDALSEEPEPEPTPYDYSTKEKAAMEALLEGDQEKYATIRAEIRQAERSETLLEAKKIASLGDKQLQETLTFEEMGERIEKQYPQFVQNSETYNESAREEMLDLYVGYAKSGLYSRVEALQRAANSAAKIHALDAAAELPIPENVVKLKQPDIKKKLKAAGNQPPVMESSNQTREDVRRDINSMSDEEYAALPESTKKRMRGDIL